MPFHFLLKSLSQLKSPETECPLQHDFLYPSFTGVSSFPLNHGFFFSSSALKVEPEGHLQSLPPHFLPLQYLVFSVGSKYLVPSRGSLT